jgi:predicted Zn-dependent protease
MYDEKPELTALVQRVGKQVAAASERPQLPWTFRVVDDASVNAFAAPGGFVYVTRGLLAHLGTEDELAAVLAHEAGHVTARHSAVQLRKTTAARRSIGVFRIIDPNLRHVGGIAAATAGLVLLKYSREDEYEADDLALRYVQRTGHAPAAIPAVFELLASVSESAGRVPTWLSTHPAPQERQKRMVRVIGGAEDRDPEQAYLETIAGIVYGVDARDGFFAGQRFVHPRAGLTLQIPEGWEGHHDHLSVVAVSEDERALFVLGPSDHASPAEAITAFFADTTVARGEAWEGKIGGFEAESAAFAVAASSGNLAGLVAFVQFDDRVLAMIGIAPEQGWVERAQSVADAVTSFSRLEEASLRDIDPMRVQVVQLSAPSTLEALAREQPSVVPLRELALLNGVTPGETLPAGRWMKRVVGFNPARE